MKRKNSAKLLALAAAVSAAAHAHENIYLIPDKAKGMPYAAVKIIRNGKTMPSNTALKCGDEVRYIRHNTFTDVRISFRKNGKQQTLVLDADKRPSYRFDCKQLSLWQRFWGMFSLGERTKEVASLGSISRSCSGCMLSDGGPMFSADGGAYLLAGKYPVRLFWYGNAAPFRLTLTSEGSQAPLASASGIANRRENGADIPYAEYTLPEIQWQPGRYRIRISNHHPVPLRDAAERCLKTAADGRCQSQNHLDLHITVLPAESAPAAYRNALARQADQAGLAEALLADDEKKWRFQVFQYDLNK